jgi:glycerol-3-phosphate dehydrogenase (NAD(P)+)
VSVAVVGAGAFGTGLAIALARKSPVTLWARDADLVQEMNAMGMNQRRLPTAIFPKGLRVTDKMTSHDVMLLAVPMQQILPLLEKYSDVFARRTLVACCKGIDLKTRLGAVDLIAQAVPSSVPAILTGPSFAADIANGLPTALTLACADNATGLHLQEALSTASLRLYRTSDVQGATLGGALKNVMAIACGVTTGAGLGHSARAALMTRGFAEMSRFAVSRGADPSTLAGLSGFGDLALTCTSEGSRNYRYGISIGSNVGFDRSVTVEGASTALALKALADEEKLDMPITQTVAALVETKMDVETAVTALMSRPLKEE